MTTGSSSTGARMARRLSSVATPRLRLTRAFQRNVGERTDRSRQSRYSVSPTTQRSSRGVTAMLFQPARWGERMTSGLRSASLTLRLS